MEEYVPSAWLHPNTQPSTHSLCSWQNGNINIHTFYRLVPMTYVCDEHRFLLLTFPPDLKKRYLQMKNWIKQRMVPVFREGRRTPESHGILRSIWPGGLVNPQALFTSLKQEKAVITGCSIDQVLTTFYIGVLISY